MSHEEPRREMLPSLLSDVTPASAIFAREDRFEASTRFDSTIHGSKSSATEWIARAFRRHWWQILPLWAMAAAAIWFFLPHWLPNTFEAVSDVELDRGPGGNVQARGGENDFLTLKETQARRIVSPKIIASALIKHPELGKRLALDDQSDPETAIYKRIAANLLPNTHIIRVSIHSAHDDNLAGIVNAVIEAYRGVATDFGDEGVIQRSLKLKFLTSTKESQVKRLRETVAKLVTKNGNLDASQGQERHASAIKQYSTLSDQLQTVQLDVVEEQAKLEQLRRNEALADQTPQPRTRTRPEVIAAFYELPEVDSLRDQLDQVKQKLEVAGQEPGKAEEANRKALQQKSDDLSRQIDEAWARLSPGLAVAVAKSDGRAKPVPESSKLEVRLNGLKARQEMLEKRLDQLKNETHSGGSEIVELEYARRDLDRAETVLGTMTQTISQVELESSQPVVRLRQESQAKTVEKSQSLPRWVLGVVGPLTVFLGLLGFFGLIEKQTGRILDPSDLPMKAQLNVIGLVPPLPKGKGGRLGLASGSQQRSQVDVERFIQSLDQLRVLICGRGDREGRLRRSLLITSASENEGKSTLAAQLAERSVNAGLLVLLIDADLRNPTLSRMFDRPESVGLANVLRGELLAEEAIGTVPEAGGFHFLPAGLVRDDLSRLLQSDRLARFLESARESFDLVLVDSPPVLPVADALTIGQWVDGAILTVRHKVSRLPLVERASRQLASVGISIVGAVVSGVKDRHAPYYGSKPSSDPERSDSVDAST